MWNILPQTVFADQQEVAQYNLAGLNRPELSVV